MGIYPHDVFSIVIIIDVDWPRYNHQHNRIRPIKSVYYENSTIVSMGLNISYAESMIVSRTAALAYCFGGSIKYIRSMSIFK